MSVIKRLEKEINDIVKKIGYDTDITLAMSNRPDLGEFQINDAMKLAKLYHKSPVEIANEIKTELDKDERFVNVNIAGAGFINISLGGKTLVDFINEIKDDPQNNIDKMDPKTIVWIMVEQMLQKLCMLDI